MICTSPACSALDISWPVASTFSFRAMPCLRKMPFSTPTKLGTWFMLPPTAAASGVGDCAVAVSARPTSAAIKARAASRFMASLLVERANDTTATPGARSLSGYRGAPRLRRGVLSDGDPGAISGPPVQLDQAGLAQVAQHAGVDQISARRGRDGVGGGRLGRLGQPARQRGGAGVQRAGEAV